VPNTDCCHGVPADTLCWLCVVLWNRTRHEIDWEDWKAHSWIDIGSRDGEMVLMPVKSHA
jgi:hypothetical protein